MVVGIYMEERWKMLDCWYMVNGKRLVNGAMGDNGRSSCRRPVGTHWDEDPNLKKN